MACVVSWDFNLGDSWANTWAHLSAPQSQRGMSLVGTGLRTYDGQGGFTQVDNSHGQLTGAARNVPATGTYEVNADCSGTSMLAFPGAPVVVETAFVIVDGGAEVNDAVMAPQPNLVSAVLRRVRK